MIIFDLECDAGHVFEAWFGSSDDFADQQQRGLLACPPCQSPKVHKAVMAPRVGRKGNQGESQRPTEGQRPAATPSAAGAVATSAAGAAPAEMKAFLRALADTQAKLLAKSNYVGARFADEARDMHLGDAEMRPIHGEATPEEAQELIEEGIPVTPLPFPVLPPEAEN